MVLEGIDNLELPVLSKMVIFSDSGVTVMMPGPADTTATEKKCSHSMSPSVNVGTFTH